MNAVAYILTRKPEADAVVPEPLVSAIKRYLSSSKKSRRSTTA